MRSPKRIVYSIEREIRCSLPRDCSSEMVGSSMADREEVTALGIFCMGIFLFFGNELGTVVFHEPLAGSFLCTLAWICPFLYLTGNINSILHGLGKTGITFINQLAAVLVRILALLLFVPRFGIEGVLWSILISQLLLCMSGLLAVSRHIHPTIGLVAYILKPATAMLLSTGGIYLLIFPVR